MLWVMTFMDRLRQRSGQGMVEYALILALVAIIVIVALVALGSAYKNLYSTISSGLSQGG
ncbi:MAG TPA: Flp family type IVb pilin [Candidatus Acidoferrales bacterium]|nr:Flp family type IVb pilin [Candidatus Acidoferrales bacterium]